MVVPSKSPGFPIFRSKFSSASSRSDTCLLASSSDSFDLSSAYRSRLGRAWFCSPFSLPLLLISVSWAPAALADGLVSNTSQANSGNRRIGQSVHRAQSFRTGTHGDGYDLESIDLNLSAAPSSAKLIVSIRADSSGNPSSAILYTLTTPDSLEVGLNEFSAPEGARLEAETKYWVYARNSNQNTGPAWKRTVIRNDLDAGAATGWRINQPYKSLGSGGWLTEGSSRSLQIQVKGTARTSSDSVTLSESSLSLTELQATDAEKTYTVALDTDPGANVEVAVTSGDTIAVVVDTDSATAGDQSTLTFTHGNSGNWNAAQTVTVRAVNDGDAAAETVTISHTAAVTDTNNPYHQIEIGDVTVTTTDAGHGVEVAEATVEVAENNTASYKIVLKSQPGGTVTITPMSSATARATVSSALTFNNSNWSTPQMMTVTGVGAGSATISHSVTTDTTAYPTSTTIASVGVVITAVANNASTVATVIPDQTATVGTAFSYAFPANTFSDADNNSLTYSAAKSDNDEAVPMLKVEIPTVTEGETGTIKLTLSHASSQSIEFVVGDTATVYCVVHCPPGTSAARPSDYSLTSTTITFAPGETTKTLSFSTTDDSTVEAAEVFIF